LNFYKPCFETPWFWILNPRSNFKFQISITNLYSHFGPNFSPLAHNSFGSPSITRYRPS
jgi:hypothetical protein